MFYSSMTEQRILWTNTFDENQPELPGKIKSEQIFKLSAAMYFDPLRK